jgi:hypothetical protein
MLLFPSKILKNTFWIYVQSYVLNVRYCTVYMKGQLAYNLSSHPCRHQQGVMWVIQIAYIKRISHKNGTGYNWNYCIGMIEVE